MTRHTEIYNQGGNPFSEAQFAGFERQRQEFDDETSMMVQEAVDSACYGEDEVKQIKCIDRVAGRFGSEHRLPNLLDIWECVSPGVFWRSLVSNWTSCDDTWDYLDTLLVLMRDYRQWAPNRRTLGRSLRVYRGCSRPRVRGVSWTTDRRVAEKFAYGHRNIRVPDPVIATALVRPADIFIRIDDRNEHEVVLDPQGLRELTMIAEPMDIS